MYVCNKCLNDKGTNLHCVCGCQNVQKFCKDVIRHLSEVFNIDIPFQNCAWSLPRRLDRHIETHQITGLWASTSQESNCTQLERCRGSLTKQWIQKLSECVGLERQTYIAKGKRK